MTDRAAHAATPPEHVTDLLIAWGQGEEAALARLMPLVHDELYRLAQRQMRGERKGHVLQTTALVNEAYVRLVDLSRVRWQDRAHFFAMSARLMRRILVDHARARRALKRGGEIRVISLDDTAEISDSRISDFVALDDALEALAKIDARKSRIVEMRFFAGLTVDETAEALHVSPQTVMRDWQLAKAWLLRELSSRPSK